MHILSTDKEIIMAKHHRFFGYNTIVMKLWDNF